MRDLRSSFYKEQLMGIWKRTLTLGKSKVISYTLAYTERILIGDESDKPTSKKKVVPWSTLKRALSNRRGCQYLRIGFFFFWRLVRTAWENVGKCRHEAYVTRRVT